jgi:hypothetical protein
MQADENVSDDGSEYSDTEDRRELKKQKRAWEKSKKPSGKDATATHKVLKKARLKAKTTFEKGDVELLGGKDTFASKT